MQPLVEMLDTPFRCMNCHSLLEIDSSLLDLSMAQRDLLLNSDTTEDYNNASKGEPPIPEEKVNLIKQIKQPSQLRVTKNGTGAASDSYVFLTDTEYSLQKYRTGDESGDEYEDEDRNKTLSARINALTNIFNILSSKNNIDYPVCQGCCDTILEKLKEEYDQELKKRDIYYEFMKRIQEHKTLTDAPVENSKGENDLRSLEKEKKALLKELKDLEDEDAKLQRQTEALQERLRLKKQQELDRLTERNIQELDQLSFLKDIQSLKNQRALTLNHIDKLRKTNIYNETFRISHNGPFGTINELRLGSIPENAVPWSEINAALGQVVLLLSLIAEKLCVSFDDYKLHPAGSMSTIEKIDKQNQEWILYKAYNGNEFSFGSLFHKESVIDKALLSILDITKRLSQKESAESQDPVAIEIPYEISGDRINGLPLALKGSSPTLEWTTACKFLLTDIKWLLAFSTTLKDRAETAV